ncbi:MAG: NUDIX domain-containing protein [Okeania sp. SIO3B5]|uniref:NUDIX domain-containing protein n=1 Tax=Okeania sp. SIO3B5 TaxID=2607811 RepID=UPI0013FFB90F|nr:NUDIX domain-containing protein [Okeania sp. SIO3B5]NEO58722.1 NUDIX domain-containing protein [Okeania sp. SIO3B5]
MNKIQGSVIILLNSNNEILLVLRDDKESIPFPNTWNLLGGILENNESPEECIRREIREEIEIELGNINFFQKYNIYDREHYVFWKQIDLDLTEIQLNEGQRLAYFTKDELDQNQLAFQCNKILNDFFVQVLWPQFGR